MEKCRKKMKKEIRQSDWIEWKVGLYEEFCGRESNCCSGSPDSILLSLYSSFLFTNGEPFIV